MDKKDKIKDGITGTLSCNPKGYFGFLISGDEDAEDIFIAGDDMADALNDDTVLVQIKNEGSRRGHREGRVVKVIKRGNEKIVGVIYNEKDGCFYVRPDSRRIYTKILVDTDEAGGAQMGDRVCVSELEYAKDGKVYGKLSEILGGEDSLKSLVEGIIICNNIKQEFDTETLREADKISRTVTSRQTEGREDLRDMLIFTIDGDDAKDFDDAVSLEMMDNGNYLLGVHIADVSEYVKEGTALDSEAFERGTSVYLADRVIPMLPETLSNGICSLNPNVDRLTLSCFMEIDKNGTVLNHRLSQTVIRSKERMTYNNVNKLLAGTDDELKERYKHLLPTLYEMEKLAKILLKKREKRGAIMFEFPECHVVVDKNGEPSDIIKEIRGTSNRMIEEFMLAANETVAEYAYWAELPFVFRSHEPPSVEKIKAFNQLILRFGLQIKGKFDEDNPIKPKAMQAVLDEVKDSAAEKVVSNEMLRSLMKAKYTETNLGHFGLAAKYYCHFTSPIRRYPDLAVHRILKKVLSGKDTGKMKAFVSAAAPHSTDREIAAENTERDVDDLMKAAYMSRFVGKDFEAVISGIAGYGMYVELDNTVEGLIRLDNMTDDFYEYDEHTGEITGKRTGKTYKTGDTVRVVLARSDIMSRQIDFVLEADADATLRKFLPKKESAAPKKPYKRKSKRKYHRKKKR